MQPHAENERTTGIVAWLSSLLKRIADASKKRKTTLRNAMGSTPNSTQLREWGRVHELEELGNSSKLRQNPAAAKLVAEVAEGQHAPPPSRTPPPENLDPGALTQVEARAALFPEDYTPTDYGAALRNAHKQWKADPTKQNFEALNEALRTLNSVTEARVANTGGEPSTQAPDGTLIHRPATRWSSTGQLREAFTLADTAAGSQQEMAYTEQKWRQNAEYEEKRPQVLQERDDAQRDLETAWHSVPESQRGVTEQYMQLYDNAVDSAEKLSNLRNQHKWASRYRSLREAAELSVKLTQAELDSQKAAQNLHNTSKNLGPDGVARAEAVHTATKTLEIHQNRVNQPAPHEGTAEQHKDALPDQLEAAVETALHAEKTAEHLWDQKFAEQQARATVSTAPTHAPGRSKTAQPRTRRGTTLTKR